MKTQVKAVRKFFNTFRRIRYFTERKRHWSEKFWWMLAFGLSAWLCASSIQHIWIKWNDRPVTMSFTEKETFVSEIPFPTVTICAETKAYKNKFDVIASYHAMKRSQNLTEKELTYMEALVNMCEFHFPNNIHFGAKFINESIYETIQEIAPTFNHTIQECEWQNKPRNCSELLSPILTGEGLCFAFNALNSKDVFTKEMAPGMMIVKNSPMVSHWNMEDGYDEGVNKDEYPIRMFNAKHGGALNIYLKLFERDLEFLCRESSVQGFKIFLMSPGQSLKMARHFMRLPLMEQAEILIKPTVTITTNDLRSYSSKQRKCFFSSDRKLRFYKMYTKNNCEAECLSNFTRLECGCVKFSMPRTKGTRICGAERMKCYKTAQKKLFGEDIIKGLTDEHAKIFRTQCNCLSSCTTIVYDAEIDRAKFDLVGTLNSHNVSADKYLGVRPSYLRISFKGHKVVTMRRSALYTNADFMAICGGLLGLFLGVSAMSVIQFIYYSTIRLYWMIRYFKSKNTIVPFKRNFVISRISIEALEAQRTRI